MSGNKWIHDAFEIEIQIHGRQKVFWFWNLGFRILLFLLTRKCVNFHSHQSFPYLHNGSGRQTCSDEIFLLSIFESRNTFSVWVFIFLLFILIHRETNFKNQPKYVTSKKPVWIIGDMYFCWNESSLIGICKRIFRKWLLVIFVFH